MSFQEFKKPSVWITVLFLIIVAVIMTIGVSSWFRLDADEDKNKTAAVTTTASVDSVFQELKPSDKLVQVVNDFGESVDEFVEALEKEKLNVPVVKATPKPKPVPLKKKSNTKKVAYKKPKKPTETRSKVYTFEQSLTEYYAKHPLKPSTTPIVNSVVVVQQNVQQPVQQQALNQVKITTGLPPIGQIKVMVPPDTKLIWGDATKWKKIRVRKGVAYISEKEGSIFLINGQMKDGTYLDKSQITLISPSGSQVRLSNSNAAATDARGNPNLKYSYSNGILGIP